MKCTILMILAFTLPGEEKPTANKVLKQVADKLNSITHLRYDYNRAISYPSENYRANTSGSLYFDFSSTDTLLGFKYQIDDKDYSNIFNGTEQFDLNKKNKTIQLRASPSAASFRSNSYFYNSIVTLKRNIPSILADENIIRSMSDTVIDNKACYAIRLSMHKRAFNYLDGFSHITAERDIHYNILVDKTTLLPRRIKQTNSVNDDHVQTDFTNINVNAALPPEPSWYYSSYSKEYKPKEEKVITPIALNAMAPDWKLPVLNSKDSLSLHQLKGKVVLLEFWIRNCGYCIEAVPTLNKYPNVFAINVNDAPSDIHVFAQKNKSNYPILYNGDKVAAQYGIAAYPMMVIINKTGKVIYTGQVNKSAIDEILKREEAEASSR